jgi:hypothetical protein
MFSSYEVCLLMGWEPKLAIIRDDITVPIGLKNARSVRFVKLLKFVKLIKFAKLAKLFFRP